jgi:hypothetical protein
VHVISGTFWVWSPSDSLVSCLRGNFVLVLCVKVGVFLCVFVCESIQAVPHLILSRILWLPICYLKNIKFKMYRTLILPDLYGCETWSVPPREERGLSVFKNKVSRMIFVPKREKVTGTCIMRCLIICTPHQMLFGWSNEGGWGKQGRMAHLVGDNSNPPRFWWEIPKETDLSEDPFVVVSITLICILNKWDGRL